MERIKNGFSAVELVLVVAIVVVLGLVTWRVWDANNTPTVTDNSQSSSNDDVPAINNVSDLDKAQKTLDDTDVDEDFDKQLETETNY